MLLLLFFQALPVYGQDPPVIARDPLVVNLTNSPETSHAAVPSDAISAADHSPTIAFVTTDFGTLREGYASLEWTDLESDATYEVTDQDGQIYYRGSFPQAFISGLSDGKYEFHVRAIDESAATIASTSAPARFTVEHWPLTYTFALFMLGLIVFLAILAILIWGTLQSRHINVPHQQEPPS
ncbi:MAG: hypothetical protein KDA60_19770 [Planctomycetales bacterium]|nr:hypothetical protein [Planctomycetales bacterium]